MSDTSLNKIIQYGTNAARIAFTPSPAVGSKVLYIWYVTDSVPDVYIWDGAAWVQINDQSSLGDTVGPVSAVDGHLAVFDGATGKLIKDGGVPSTGDVVGPGSAVSGHLAVFSGATGKLLSDGGVPATGTGDVVGPASAVDDHLVKFSGTTGKLVKDGGVAPAGDVVGPGSAVSGHLAIFSGTTGKLLSDGGAPASGSGDFVGPGSAVDGHMVVFDGTTGKLGKDGGAPGAGGSGSLILLEQHTASASATLDFTTGITSTYDTYQLELVGLIPATASGPMLQVSTDGGSTWQVTNYTSGIYLITNAFASTQTMPDATAIWIFGTVVVKITLEGISGTIKLFHPGSTAIAKTFTVQVAGVNNGDGNRYAGFGHGAWTSTTAVNALRFKFASGNIASGTIRLYGLAK